MNIDKIVASIPTADAGKRNQMRLNAESWLATGSDVQKQAAQTLLDALDVRSEQEREELFGELEGLETAERILRSFGAHPMTETEARLIQVLLDNPRSTSSVLSSALGWGGQAWHLHFGTMCANRRAYLWPMSASERRDNMFYSGILADYDEAGAVWTMKPDVAAAFAKIGIKPKRRTQPESVVSIGDDRD